ncbi:pentapeptide repeat-containing protein [Actinosynnema sp. NPDC050436]|uniref:pentapeptide repeat-containing protein n=1 Tax=Actinosynnema sp. NPDC050436 TaxID=3155659 RepID=UPI0033DCE586
MHEALRLFDAYWPALLGFLTLFAAWRVARATIRVWSGQEVIEEAEEPDEIDGARGSMAWAVVKWLLLAVLLAGATGFGLFWLLGRPSLPSAASFTTAELLDLLKIGLAVVGGLGAVVALAVAYRKQQVSEAAHVMATRQDEREATKYLNERYGKAAEQLGHDSFAVRLAGVHAMVGLANDWPEQRQTCVDVLCGYLRTPYPRDDRTEREVRQAIITTLLDQDWRSRELKLDFQGAEFENLNLAHRVFTGRFTFDNATFHGDLTDFRYARFRGEVTFRDARFTSRLTSFSEITATKAKLDLRGAEFSGELVDFGGAILTQSELDLSDASVHEAALDFRWMVVDRTTLSLERAVLRRTTLDLSSVNTLPINVTVRAGSSFVLRTLDAANSTIRFTDSRLSHSTVHLDGARFADCALEADGVDAAGVELSAVGVEPAGFAEAVRRMKNAGRPKAPGVPGETAQ